MPKKWVALIASVFELLQPKLRCFCQRNPKDWAVSYGFRLPRWRCLPVTTLDPEHITSPPVHSVAFGDPRSSTQRHPPPDPQKRIFSVGFNILQNWNHITRSWRHNHTWFFYLLSKLHVCAYIYILTAEGFCKTGYLKEYPPAMCGALATAFRTRLDEFGVRTTEDPSRKIWHGGGH